MVHVSTVTTAEGDNVRRIHKDSSQPTDMSALQCGALIRAGLVINWGIKQLQCLDHLQPKIQKLVWGLMASGDGLLDSQLAHSGEAQTAAW